MTQQITVEQIIGRWKTDRHDSSTLDALGDVIQEFFPGGLLMYATRQDNGEIAIMELRYHLEGEWLVTNQPSAPRRDRVRVSLDESGRLVVGEGADRTLFIRGATASFDRQ